MRLVLQRVELVAKRGQPLAGPGSEILPVTPEGLVEWWIPREKPLGRAERGSSPRFAE